MPITHDFVIVGAGLGGIALAVNLARAGIDDILVIEQSDGPGGVWWDNTYPGCEVDTESIAYSYSFLPYDWTREYGPQPAVQQYCEDVIDHFDLRDRFVFSTKVERARWNEVESAYDVELSDGRTLTTRILASATGMLNVPRYPEWPGLDRFEGPAFHTARWEHEHDLAGKRIAVVGTGCTAAQVVPALALSAAQVYVFQREPGWVLPKQNDDLSARERRHRLSRPLRTRFKRYRSFLDIQRGLVSFRVGSRTHDRFTTTCLDHIEAQISDPELRAAVTPAYPFGCKRPIYSSLFYPALDRPDVELVPKAVSSLTPTGIVDSDGVEREVDVVVMAVGFRADDYLSTLPVEGPGGRSARDIWAGSPRALGGVTVAGLPNFFMMYGPNTNGGGPITAQHERQAEAIVKVVKRMRRRGAVRVETDEGRMDRYAAWVDRKNLQRLSAAATGCHNYFYSPTGRNVTQWPLGHLSYKVAVRLALRLGVKVGAPARADAPTTTATATRA